MATRAPVDRRRRWYYEPYSTVLGLTLPLCCLPMTSTEPQIDFTKIAFPSDQLSVKRLRELFPELIDKSIHGVKYFGEDELTAMMNFERGIAQRAFDAAIGKIPAGEPARDENLIETLTDCYMFHKMVSGSHHAEQLIRTFEQAAVEQARSHCPQPPSR
jgi:hypothetical protein